MVDGYLAFARGEGSEVAVPVYIDTMLNDVVEEARRGGADVTFNEFSGAQLMGRPNALKRAVTNLIDNAVRYSYEVTLAARKNPEALEITVEDNGPGIPESQRESVFKPFFRMDQSRNAETGGVGLGLTIARDVVRNHGGYLVLSESPRGGVSALIRLPL